MDLPPITIEQLYEDPRGFQVQRDYLQRKYDRRRREAQRKYDREFKRLNASPFTRGYSKEN